MPPPPATVPKPASKAVPKAAPKAAPTAVLPHDLAAPSPMPSYTTPAPRASMPDYLSSAPSRTTAAVPPAATPSATASATAAAAVAAAAASASAVAAAASTTAARPAPRPTAPTASSSSRPVIDLAPPASPAPPPTAAPPRATPPSAAPAPGPSYTPGVTADPADPFETRGVPDAVRLALSTADVKIIEEASPYTLNALTNVLDDQTETATDTQPYGSDEDDAEVVGDTTDATKPMKKKKKFAAAKRYKIAMFSWESLHSVAVGGVAPHLTELSAGLERRGHEVHVFVRTGAGQKPYERIDGVHVHRISFELSADFVQEVHNMCDAMVHFMLETEGFMNTKFDICHAHDWLAAPALINLKRNHGHTCVFTVHSTEFGRCGNNVYGGQSARIRDIEAQAIGLADRVVGVSGVLCDEIKGHYSFEWDKLRCVYNGINCLRYDGSLWDPAEVRGQYGVGPMDPMVLFVGRMATQKGPDILVESIPMVLASRPDAKFVMVGDGYMKDELVARVHELNVAGSVCFPGQMSGQPLVDLFKATDLVAIPSRNEPFGIVTLEAWASNKPVVVTTSGGPREFVWHDNDGYLVDTSAEGMAWGIGTAFGNFEHMKYMGERGRVKAAFQFSWDNIAENTNNVYDELLPDHPGRTDIDNGAEEEEEEEEEAEESEKPVEKPKAMGMDSEEAAQLRAKLARMGLESRASVL